MTSRQWFIAALLISLTAISCALYYQLVLGYEPCSLCEIQRFIYMLTASILLIAIIHHPKYLGIRIYAILALLIAILGIVIASRQVWLQHLPPDQVPACGPGLNFLIENLPLAEAIKAIFMGNADCASVHWRFLGLSFAGWSLVVYGLLSLLAVWQLIFPKRRPS